ncbi:MAG: pectinesterase family protein [Lachnospiraceae bacterium]
MRKVTLKRVVASCAATVLTATTIFGSALLSNIFSVDAYGAGKSGTVIADDGDAFYDFRDGSVIPTDTDGKSDVTKGNLTVKVGTKNAYQYNGDKHGVAFKDGNSIEIKVAGAAKIIVGDCLYSNSTQLTLKDADGSYVETKDAKAGCYHNDGSAITFTYPEHEATTLVLEFTNTAYVPSIEVVALDKTYNFRDKSILDSADAGSSPAVTYGGLSVTEKSYRYNDGDHGVQFVAGEVISLAVAGPTKVIVGDCLYSNGTQMTLSNPGGSYSETIDGKKGCYHNDGSALVFTYDSEAATTLTLNVVGGAYIPEIKLEAILTEKPDDNGVPFDSFYDYNFSDGSVLAVSYDAANQLNGSVKSKDGFLTLTSAGTMYTHDTQHGLAVLKGDKFDVAVAGDATVTFHLCQYGTNTGSINGTCKKGKLAEKSFVITDGRNDGLTTVSFHYTGVATTLTFTVNGEEGAEYYLHGLSVSNNPAPTEKPELVGNGKIDIWDFGCEEFDTTKYNNMITLSELNGIYPSTVEVGSKGNTIGSFDLRELVFRCGGRTNNRIRSSNTSITRYDDKNPVTIDGATMTGYVYANNASPTQYIGLKCYPNDKITLYTGSNGGASTIYFESPSGVIQKGDSNASGVKLTFYATEFGEYKIYSTNEKLVLYRALREHAQPVVVSGSVDTTKAEGISDYKLAFKCVENGTVVESEVVDGSYAVDLYEGYNYKVSLVNANGYVIETSQEFVIAKDEGNKTFNIGIKAVDLVKITGKLTGLTSEAIAKLELSFKNDEAIYVPTFELAADGAITVNLEKGVKYDIVAEGINDYYLSDITTIQKSEDGSQDIAFTAKPVYDVTVNYVDISDAAKASAIITFTNINEAGYVYTFKAGEKVQLRDGQYSIVVTGTAVEPYAQKKTADAKVNGAATTVEVPFEPLTSWNFAQYNGAPGIETIGDAKYYLGLGLTGNIAENKIYLLVGGENASNNTPAGAVKIPAKKGDIVTVQYCYCSDFNIDGEVSVKTNTGSTSTIETTVYVAKEDGVTINGVGQTYFTSITVSPSIEYSSKITVGKDKQFKTINDALAYVSKMDRPNNERVEIVIDPGNYEEMLRINVSNVSLVNAAGSAASLQLTNKGVDIDKNAVRITSYYGHGYNYYSMGADSLYDADALKVNQANGYLSHTNPGSGTTNNSYWNATVVVYADGFEAKGIIFENSFNQYISAKEAADTVVCWETGSKGVRPTTVGDTSVQNKSFVERAAAMAIVGDKAAFKNCKFIGRQDTLYGGVNTTAAFEKCDILGGTDYIFGGMKAVFDKCNLVLNTSEASTDVAYITAAQQAGGRGYLMNECRVTSTTPGVDTASQYRSKPGFFGRPWAGNTSEVVFVNTIVETTDFPGYEGKSLIDPAGWNSSLGGESKFMTEYNTTELSGEDNSASRVTWAQLLNKPVLDNGATPITFEAFLGSWNEELVNNNFFGIDYDILEGDNVKAEAGKDLVVTSSAPFNMFVCVKVDGVVIGSDCYDVKEGSTVVTLKAAYLATLSAGEHTVQVVSNDGVATTTIVIPVPAAQPTGDTTPIALYVLLLAIGAAGIVVARKRKVTE